MLIHGGMYASIHMGIESRTVYIAGHFLGNNTVIDVLRREGYEVEHTPAGQPINR